MAVPNPPHLDMFTEPGSALLKLSPFLKHLYSMLELPDSDPSIMCWLASGNGFLVLDRTRLCSDVRDSVCCVPRCSAASHPADAAVGASQCLPRGLPELPRLGGLAAAVTISRDVPCVMHG